MSINNILLCGNTNQAIDLMTGAKEEICLLPYKPTDISVGGYNGKILKITF